MDRAAVPFSAIPRRLSLAHSMNHLEEALDLAARGWGATSPNPAVGAVVVRDGQWSAADITPGRE